MKQFVLYRFRKDWGVMKKKFAWMCMVGLMVFGISACGDKKTQNNAVETVVSEGSEQANSQEGAQETPSTQERVSDRADYVGIQDLDIDTYITLADYKNMKVSVARPEVTDETIESYVNTKLLVGSITDKAVQEGDVVNIDFEGKKDGVAFAGGAGQGYQLEIGSGAFIPGFEEGLIGVMPGETVDLNLSFPEIYRNNPDLAGQAVVFTVTVNSIRATAEYATVTEEEMAHIGLSYKTKEELWEAGKVGVEKNADETYQANIKTAIVQKLMEQSTASSIPEYLVEEEVENYNIYMRTLAQSVYGMELEDFVSGMFNMTMDEYNTQIHENCKETIKQYLIMEAVIRAEGIEITEDMINQRAAEEAVEYGYASAQDLIDDVGYTTYRISIVQEKALERLSEIVTVEEEEKQDSTE